MSGLHKVIAAVVITSSLIAYPASTQAATYESIILELKSILAQLQQGVFSVVPPAALTSGQLVNSRIAPAAVWSFEESAGKDVFDRYNNNTGQLIDGALRAKGKVGQGVLFDGVNDVIKVNPATSYNNLFVPTLSSDGGTIAAWIYPTGWGETSYGRIIDKSSGTDTRVGYSLMLDGIKGANALRFAYGFDQAVGGWETPKDSIKLNQWQHIAVTYSASSNTVAPQLYINGVPQVVTTANAPVGSRSSDAALTLRMGNYNDLRTFMGTLDEVQLYKGVLSAAEVKSLAENVPTTPTTPTSATSTKFSLQTSVVTLGSVDVYDNEGRSRNGTQAKGVKGVIVGGPTYNHVANLSSVPTWWWRVNFSTGADGWVSESGLISASAPAPTPTTPITPTPTSTTPTTPRDGVAPTISLTAPANAVVSGPTVQVAANASDAVGVSGVQFLLNGSALGVEDTRAPYEIVWDTTKVANGTYTITAVARDAAGNSATARAVTVTVNNTVVVVPPPTTPTTCPYPAQVLDLALWKLTLPAGGTEKPTEILQNALKTFSDDKYFYAKSDCKGVVFTAPVNAVTTSGSNYPRSELREMTAAGRLASWSAVSGVHRMFIDQAILAVPKTKKHVVAGQIHDANDDVIVIRLEHPKLFVDINGNDGPVLDANYTLGKRFTVEFVARNGAIEIYYNGSTKPVYTLPHTASGNYFKAGAYTQSNCTRELAADCTASNAGTVEIYDVRVTHE